MSSPATHNRPSATDASAITENFTVGIVDLDQNVRAVARDIGQLAYTEEMNAEGGRFRRIMRNIWKGSVLKEYYEYRHTAEAEEQIRTEVSLYIGVDAERRQAATQATVNRFTSDLVHTDAGETHQTLNPDASPAESRIVDGVRGLIGRYASGALNDDQLTEERRGLFAQLASDPETADLVPKGEVYADNIEIIARNVLAAIDHGVSLDEALARVKVVTGEARTGVRTEAKHNKFEKIIDKINQSKVGSLVGHPTAVVSALSIGASLLRFGSEKVIYAAGKTIVPGIAGGVLGGVKESYRIKDERRQHGREMAQGGQYESGAKRRDQIEATRYETISAIELTRPLGLSLDADGMPRTDLSSDEVQELVQNLARAVAHTRLSDRDKRDFISYSSVDRVEEERGALDLSINEAKSALRGSLEFVTDDTLRTSLGLEAGQELEVAIDAAVSNAVDVLQGDVNAKDAEFKTLHRNRVLLAAGKTALFGASIGLIAQEGIAAIDDSRNGLVEGWFGSKSEGRANESLLKGVFNHDNYEVTGTNGEQLINNHIETLGQKTDAILPDGFRLQQGISGENTFDLLNAKNEAIANVQINPDGSISEVSLALLANKGINVTDMPETLHNIVETTRTVGRGEYLQHNGAVQVDRSLWYDNNTPGPVYDKNELGLHWGGNKGTDGQGNILMNVSTMKANGSFHGSQSVEWQQAASEGRIKLGISLDKANQNNVLMVDVDANGNAVIPVGSPAASLFTIGANGRPVFHGQYVEVMQMMGQGDKGEQVRMLATYVGQKNAPTSFDVIDKTDITSTAHHLNFEVPPEAVDGGNFIEMAPFIPITNRKAIEKLTDKRSPLFPDFKGSYYGGGSLESGRQWLANHPEVLSPYDKITSPDGTVRWVDAEGKEVVRDVDRERRVIQEYVSGIESSNPAYYNFLNEQVNQSRLQPMDDANRVSVNIPAWMEGKNIYNLLAEYADQVDGNGQLLPANSYEINIIVNRKRGSEPDNSVAEIERFIGDRQAAGKPIKINFVDTEFDPPNNNVGFARKVMTDLTLLRTLRRSGQAGPLYIESEDADLLKVDKQTIHNLVSKLDKEPHLDAVRGIEDRSPKDMMNNDFLFLQRRLWDFSIRLWQSKKLRPENNPNWNYTFNRVVTGGWNTGYSAEGIALIGGYEVVSKGEDLLVGERLTLARGDGSMPNLDVVGRTMSRSDSSPRRFISEILTGRGAYSEAFEDEGLNRFIRDASVDELMSAISQLGRINSDNVGDFSFMVENYYQMMRQVAPSAEEAQKLYQRLMFFAGFKENDYEYVNNGAEVRVKKWDNVKGALEGYRQKNSPAADPTT